MKILLEPHGAIVALTMKTDSILFVLTHRFVGFKTIKTADRVVARAGYSAPGTLALISELYHHDLAPATGRLP